jgi:hypothetical protein
VKYVVLIYSNPVNWGHPSFLRTPEGLALSDAERDQMTRDLQELITELEASGELVEVAALADPRTVRTVQVRGRERITTDGPYLETKEHLAGLFIIDCSTPERAEEIAARFPEAQFSAVELRAIEG